MECSDLSQHVYSPQQQREEADLAAKRAGRDAISNVVKAVAPEARATAQWLAAGCSGPKALASIFADVGLPKVAGVVMACAAKKADSGILVEALKEAKQKDPKALARALNDINPLIAIGVHRRP